MSSSSPAKNLDRELIFLLMTAITTLRHPYFTAKMCLFVPQLCAPSKHIDFGFICPQNIVLAVEHPGPLVQTSNVQKWGFELVLLITALLTEMLASMCLRSLYLNKLVTLRENRGIAELSPLTICLIVD